MSHDPSVVRIRKDTITCRESGVIEGGGPEGEDVPCTTLADLEAFAAELRRLGAPDGLLLENNGRTFTVTLDRLAGG